MSTVNHFFQLLGLLAAVFSAYIGYMAYLNDIGYESESGLNRIKLKVADVVAPSEYTFNTVRLDVIRRNTHFVVEDGDVAYLYADKKLPFSVRGEGNQGVFLNIDGRSHYFNLGTKRDFHDPNCFMWLYSIKDGKYSFELRCKE